MINAQVRSLRPRRSDFRVDHSLLSIEYSNHHPDMIARPNRTFDLEDRLVDFSVRIVAVVEALPHSKARKHVANQLVRSGTSPAPNYGEAQSAESVADFIHKLKVALNELRETRISLEGIERKPMCSAKKLGAILTECDELIAILSTSVKTAQRNAKKP
jgi:four helix bundle protein